MRLAHRRRQSAPARSSRQQGATIVEAALVLPIFFTLVLGFIDIGLGVFQTSQATSAAADGARVGIVRLGTGEGLTADDREAIEDAVHGRLAGQDVDEIDIGCVNGAGGIASCTTAGFIKVTVSWPFEPLSFVGHALPVQSIEGSSTLAIARQPTPAADDVSQGG